jgi:formiminoglutamase
MSTLSPADPAFLFRGTPEDPRLGALVREGPPRAPAGGVAAALIGFADDRGIANGGGRPGARFGPGQLRHFLYRATPGMDGELSRLALFDLGDAGPGGAVESPPAPGQPPASGQPSIEEVHAAVEEAARAAIAAGACAVLLGGGHDGAYAGQSGLLSALPEGARLCCINVDAHLDVRPLRDGKITSGTPFRRLKERWGPRYTAIEFGIQPQHNAAAHARWARENGFAVHLLAGERAQGPLPDRFARLLAEARKADAVALSLDLDAVCAASAPGVSAPCADGFAPGVVLAFARLAGREPRVRLLEVMELSPPHDPDGRTARLGAAAIWSFLAGLCERQIR